MRLELRPGEPVSEAQLVEQFGFSKAAVRAGLARLRVEGLMVCEPRQGHVVAPITATDILEIYDLRLQLEPPAAAAAAGRMPSADVGRLRALTTPALDLTDPDSVERFMQANRAVHVAVAEAAGNRRAAAFVTRLLDDSDRVRLAALLAGAAANGERVRAEHRHLLDAIEVGNAEEAAAVMADAIRAFRDELVDLPGIGA